MTTDQQNLCRAVEAMKLDLLRSGKEPAWLVTYPGVTLTSGQAFAWGAVDGEPLAGIRVCGLVEGGVARLPAGFFIRVHPRPAWP